MPAEAKNSIDIHIFPLGDAALVVQFGDTIHPSILAAIRTFTHALTQRPFPGFIELVPAYTTVTIYYNPVVVSQNSAGSPYARVKKQVLEILDKKASAPIFTAPRVVEIPVCYGRSFGPDLEYVARLNQLEPEDVVALHAAPEYLVYMLGFAPGFPYLGGMNPKISAPRKETPRASVWAGSVGIAGNQTGIYSITSPGGWQIIGRTPLPLFNPHRQEPSLLQPGDAIRFVPISEKEFAARKGEKNGA